MANVTSGLVESVLFNGANSRVLIRDKATGGEIDVAIPQTGEFRSLKRADQIHIGWDADQSLCFLAE